MKKIFSLSLMATALLISGNLWAFSGTSTQADGVACIGTEYYATLADAIADVPADNNQVTIVLQKDQNYTYTTKYYATIGENQNVKLDLNGCTVNGVSSYNGSLQGLLQVSKGYLTIIDSKFDATIATTGEDLKNLGGDYSSIKGKLTFAQTQGVGTDGSVVCNSQGTVVVESGALILLTDPTTANNGAGASYCLDVLTNGGIGAAYGTINGGYFVGPRECFRTFANSTTTPCVLTINNAICYGMNGIFFVQDPSGSRSGKNEVTVVNGDFYSDNNPMIRLYTTGDQNLGATKISITGGTCNKDALMISHTYGEKYNGTVEQLLTNLQAWYPDVFQNITGGTFASENFQVKVYGVKNSAGEIMDNTTEKIYPSTLPTILSQGYYDKNNETGTITIVPITNHNITSTTDWDNMSSEEGQKATLGVSVDVTGTKEVSAIEVQNNVVLTVKDGAKLIVGDGGILVDEGGKIVVEAGGILQVGAKGIKNLNTNELIVRTNTEASGVVSLAPKALTRQDTKLTVEMTSKARYDGAYYWQYIGLPTNDEPTREKVSGNAFYLYEWDANAQDWQEASSFNKPFMGYIFSSNATATGARYNFSGNINNNQNVTFDLKPKWNLLANSYMAPIDLASFFEAMGKTAGVEAAISIYDANQGTYKVVTRDALKYDDKAFKTLAPMQGFFINTTEGGNCTFDYAQCVWGQEGTDPLRAPSREDKSNVNFMKINVSSIHHADEFAMFIGEKYSSSFDNGADASKFMNDYMNLYASLDDNVLASLATDNLVGTQLSFEAGEDVEYTMTFSNRNNDNFVLVDNANGARVAMTDGATYTFVATPNSTDANRFEIRKITSVVTGNEDAIADGRKDGTYLVNGRLVIVKDGKAFNVLGL